MDAARLAALPLAVRQRIQALALGHGETAADATNASAAPRPSPPPPPPPPPPCPVTFLRPDPFLAEAASSAAAADALAYLDLHGSPGALAGGALDAGVRGDTAAWLDRARLDTEFSALAAALDAFLPAAAAAVQAAGFLQGSPSRTSIQVAAYAPGSAGYARHADGGPGAPGRAATAILYLGGSGGRGGELVLYPAPSSSTAATQGEPALTVPPQAGRALAWAAAVPHEVRPLPPGPGAARVAVSVFFYGDGRPAAEALPIPRPPLSSAHTSNDRIFIAIPAFRDADARWTIRAAFAAAARPDRVVVGIAWQADLPDDADILTPVGGGGGGACWPGTVREVRIPTAEASGPASARRLALGLWAGEGWVLSVDAHTRFRDGWDDLLLAWWAAGDAAEATDGKLVLTAYPPPHEGWGPAASFPSADLRPTLLCADRFGADGMLRLVGRRLARPWPQPIPSLFYGAGLAFAPAALLTSAAPYDAWMAGAFFGEEADVWVRAASVGWRAAAPPEAVVSTSYETGEAAGHRRGRAPARTSGAAAAWAARESACMAAASGGGGGGGGGDVDPAFRARLGSAVPVAQVWAAAGVDWVERGISERGRWGGLAKADFAE